MNGGYSLRYSIHVYYVSFDISKILKAVVSGDVVVLFHEDTLEVVCVGRYNVWVYLERLLIPALRNH